MALYLDPETVALLREALDSAWACLPPEQQATMQKSTLAVQHPQIRSSRRTGP